MVAASPNLAVERTPFWSAFRTRTRVTIGVMLAEIKRHRSGARLALPLQLVEFAGQIIVLALLFSLIGRRPAFGDSIVLFLVTGLIPFWQFIRSTEAVTKAEMLAANKLRNPLATVVTYALADALVVSGYIVCTAILLCLAMDAIGINYAIPQRPEYCVAAVFLMGLLAFGVGLFNSVVTVFFRGWFSIWRVIVRGMFILSGIFYVIDFLPHMIRQYLEWNPIAHGIILFRHGFYENYPTLVLDVPYMLGFGLVATLLALSLERLLRRKIH